MDCLISTPCRLAECMDRGMKLRGTRLIVLDEADRLLDASDGIGGERRKRRTKDNVKDDDADDDHEEGAENDDDDDD